MNLCVQNVILSVQCCLYTVPTMYGVIVVLGHQRESLHKVCSNDIM